MCTRKLFFDNESIKTPYEAFHLNCELFTQLIVSVSDLLLISSC